MLGLEASADEAGRLFDSLDDDGSGTLDYHELKAKLRRFRREDSSPSRSLSIFFKDHGPGP